MTDANYTDPDGSTDSDTPDDELEAALDAAIAANVRLDRALDRHSESGSAANAGVRGLIDGAGDKIFASTRQLLELSERYDGVDPEALDDEEVAAWYDKNSL